MLAASCRWCITCNNYSVHTSHSLPPLSLPLGGSIFFTLFGKVNERKEVAVSTTQCMHDAFFPFIDDPFSMLNTLNAIGFHLVRQMREWIPSSVVITVAHHAQSFLFVRVEKRQLLPRNCKWLKRQWQRC